MKVKKLDIIYSQIKEFIKKSPGEVLIIDFHRFPFPSIWDKKLHHKFINYTLEQLGDYAYSKGDLEEKTSRGPTMDEIWKAGKNIIFTYAEKRFTKSRFMNRKLNLRILMYSNYIANFHLQKIIECG